MSRIASISIRLLLAALPLTAAASALADTAAPYLRTTWDESRLQPGDLEALLVQAMRESVLQAAAGATVRAEVVDLRAVPDSLSGIALDAVGRLQIGSGAWIPLRVTAGYDLSRSELAGLRLRPIAAGSPPRNEGVEASVLDRIDAQVSARLQGEFPEQLREVVLVDLASTSGGAAHAAFRGLGWVEFDGEGQAPLKFTAVFDRDSGLLVAFDYSLQVLDAHGEQALLGSIAAAD
jgi:hypothetical protein